MKKTRKLSQINLIDKYGIEVGDRFYLNSHTVRKGLDLPDYQIITWIKGEFFGAKYENHGIGNIERTMSANVLQDSNLNPNISRPSWIFVGKG